MWCGIVAGLGVELLALRWWTLLLSPRERPWAGTWVVWSLSNTFLAGRGL